MGRASSGRQSSSKWARVRRERLSAAETKTVDLAKVGGIVKELTAAAASLRGIFGQKSASASASAGVVAAQHQGGQRNGRATGAVTRGVKKEAAAKAGGMKKR